MTTTTDILFFVGRKRYVFDPDTHQPLTPKEGVLISCAFQSMGFPGSITSEERTAWMVAFLDRHDLWRHFRECPIPSGPE